MTVADTVLGLLDLLVGQLGPPSTRLPTGATLDQGKAATIAADQAQRAAAHAFWEARFAALGENPFGAHDTPALRLAAALADGELATLVPGRGHLTTAADRPSMLQRSGCMVSAEEIARAIRSDATAAELFADLAAFATAAQNGAGPADTAQVARGIRASRELFDAARRYRLCKSLSGAFALDLDEAFALYRQEGGLGVTPPRESFAHGPLIETGKVCRTPDVSLFDASAERPGFDLVFRFRSATDAAANDESKRFELLFRNLVVIGGLDSIVAPRLPAGDELGQLFKMAWEAVPRPAPLARIETDWRSKLSPATSKPFNASLGSQRRLLDELVKGLIMADLDGTIDLPKAEQILDNAESILAGLGAAHAFEGRARGANLDIHLVGDLVGSDTERCLDIQATWYASRTLPWTLVAREDRTAALRTLPRFPPFLSYLRFHSGDAVFMGVLLRAIAKLKALDQEWGRHADWGTEFRDAFAASSWSQATASELAGLVTSHWRPKVGNETAWRHIGLIEAIDAAGDSPTWLRPAAPPSAKLKKTAEVARKAIEAIEQQELMDALAAALSLTPITTLVDLDVLPTGASDRRLIMTKAHSFERLRLAYRDAIATAQL